MHACEGQLATIHRVKQVLWQRFSSEPFKDLFRALRCVGMCVRAKLFAFTAWIAILKTFKHGIDHSV